MRPCYYSFLFTLSCFINAPAAMADISAMHNAVHQQPQLSGLDICHGGGCALVSHVSLSAEEWQNVRDIFIDGIENEEQEREVIALAIGEMESIIGEKTGTSTDRGGTFGNSAYPGQMDCNDEAINTTNYLRLMQQDGLIKFHRLGDLKRRGVFLNGWPHTTATIESNADHTLYAVDAWFYDNGEAATILPFTLWINGWKPAAIPSLQAQ